MFFCLLKNWKILDFIEKAEPHNKWIQLPKQSYKINQDLELDLISLHKKKEKKKRHRTATTAYPCFLPDLGDSAGAGRAARLQS